MLDQGDDISILRISHKCSCSIDLIKELRKRDKMWGLPSILLLFRNELNEFNNTGAQLLDSIYHMTLKVPKIAVLAWKGQYFAIFYAM